MCRLRECEEERRKLKESNKKPKNSIDFKTKNAYLAFFVFLLSAITIPEFVTIIAMEWSIVARL